MIYGLRLEILEKVMKCTAYHAMCNYLYCYYAQCSNDKYDLIIFVILHY